MKSATIAGNKTSAKNWLLLFLTVTALVIACECACVAQEPTPAASAPTTSAVDNKDSKSKAASDSTSSDSKSNDAKPAAVSSVTPSVKETGGFLGLGKKEIYTGPTEIVVLAPTPMLDNEGKQRLDPDGKPMFNAPVKQQRDKFGHPLFDEHGKPVFQTTSELGYDEHGHKLHAEKVKPPKMTPVSIAQGTYTVDGVIGKAELNYDIADLKYIYLYAPGIGVTVISNEPFPGAKEQPNGFNDKTLTVNVDGHTLQLYSENRLLAKPQPAYVLVDREFMLPAKFPVMGYGGIRAAPYAWPGAKQGKALAGPVVPPPIPMELRPVMLLAPCPAGQMRMQGPKVLPGETAPPQPCVAIAKAMPVQVSAKPASPATSTLPAGQNLTSPR